MRFEILALRRLDPPPAAGFIAEVTLGYADLTITGAHLGVDDAGRHFVAFPKLAGHRARIHCKSGGTRKRMVLDAVAVYAAMGALAETPVAKASPKSDTFHGGSPNP